MATDLKAGAPGVSLADQPKTMGIFSMTLFAVSAMITLDTVATSSALGVQSITLFILFAIVFLAAIGIARGDFPHFRKHE